jgi:hypothetical protein
MSTPTLVETPTPPTPLKNYHNHLAAHLASLIKQVNLSSQTSASLSIVTTLTEAPPNNRQHSDSSLESGSKFSSGLTTQSRKSSYETGVTSVETKEEEQTTGAEEVLQHDDPISPASRNDLTARPDRHPPHFSPSFHDRDVSSAGPSRGGSRSSRSSYVSPEVVPIVKPAKRSPTRLEIETREQEQRRAWEVEGRKVWRSVPKGFELKLEKKTRTGSNGSLSVVPSLLELSGAGPGSAIRTDEVFPAIDPVDMERTVSNVPTTVESASEISQPVPASTASVGASLIKPKHTSTHHRRQPHCQAEDEVASTDRMRHPTTASQEEHEEYLRKRTERLGKRQERLVHNINIWWSGVEKEWSTSDLPLTPPEILPYLPSPSISSTQLRFLPVGNNMPDLPDLFDTKGPVLRLPILTGDSRRKRLQIIGEHQNESDVDLLIRLSEINQRHAPNMYSRITPCKMPSPPLSRSRDERNDASRVHSMNVTTSMATPKPNPNRGGYM